MSEEGLTKMDMKLTECDPDLVAVTEQISDWRTDEFAIQLEERTVANVLLSGGASRNGHRYSETALREAAALYERKPVFLDHAANLAKPYERSMRDLAGWIEESQYVSGRIQGSIRVLDTEAGRTLLALMASETPVVGMSHVILARKSGDGTIVEKIHDVVSVDAVVFPATTAGFREHYDPAWESDFVAEWEAERSEYLRRIEELHGERDRLLAERHQLQQRCEELMTDAAQRDLDRQLTASGLPDYAITSVFREQLRSAANAETRSRLIAEHRQFVLQCRQRAPCSQGRSSQADDREAAVNRQLVQAVKGAHHRH